MDDFSDPLPNTCKSRWRRFVRAELRDVKRYHFWRSSATEFYGALWLVMFLTGAGCRRPDQEPPSRMLTALTIAFTVNMMVLSTVGLSGAQVNPAITVMLTVTKRNTVSRGVVYFVLQCLGGVCGILAIKQLFPANMTDHISVIKPAHDVTVGQAFGIEVILGIVIGFATLAMIEPRRTDTWGNLPYGFGILMASNYLFVDAVTPICMNPAFSIGPMIALWDAEYQWIYTFGPIIGLVVGGFMYDFIFAEEISDRWNKKLFIRKSRQSKSKENGRKAGFKTIKGSSIDSTTELYATNSNL